MLSAGSVEEDDVTCKRQCKTNSNYSSLCHDSIFFPNTLLFKTKTQTMLYIHLKSELLYVKQRKCKLPLPIGRNLIDFQKQKEKLYAYLILFTVLNWELY